VQTGVDELRAPPAPRRHLADGRTKAKKPLAALNGRYPHTLASHARRSEAETRWIANSASRTAVA
jgi:hypothetical protein